MVYNKTKKVLQKAKEPKKSKANLFAELKESIINPKTLFKTFAKDLILIIFLFSLVLAYMLILNKTMPQNPGFTKENIMSSSQEALDLATASFQKFYILFITLSILGSFLILASLTFVKDWIWSGFENKKIELKSFHKFFGVNIIMYLIATAISILLILLSGFLMQFLSSKNVSLTILQVIAIMVLVILSPIILQLLNFSSYTFARSRGFVSSIVEPFKSFRKIKSLLLPYLLIIMVFTIMGLLANLTFYLITARYIALIISIFFLLLLILFISWQKYYSFIVFKRVYK